MPTYVETWDETKPAGSRARSLGDDDIREFKAAIRERLATDHNFLADETGVTTIGYHSKVTLIAGSDPAAVADCGILYTKDVSAKAELHWIDEDGDILQITDGGAFHSRINNPAGLIALWSGAIAAVPADWVFCNGGSSTPDLRDKFIVGAKQDDGGVAKTNLTGSLTQSGGTATLTGLSGSHILLTTEIPAHAHNIDVKQNYTDSGSVVAVASQQLAATTTLASASAGGGGGHTHTDEIPPYYALAFIMKN